MGFYAVIDIGTNTCNLLIAKTLPDKSFETVYDRKLPVKLGHGGIHKDILLPDAIERGLKALHSHSKTIGEYGVNKVKIVGTSALRGAINRSEFLEKVKHIFGWEIQIIDGEHEAELIFKGVQLSLPVNIGKYLILDIGGGSIEFILAKDNDIILKKSFNIGIARALETIQMSDPVLPSEIVAFEKWFDKPLQDFWITCNQHKPLTLIGCSGAFDTFMDIHEKAFPDTKIRVISGFPINDFLTIHERLIKSDNKTRAKMEGMNEMRVEMIVIASIFTNLIIQRLSIKTILHTHNSLKEGVMDQLISKEL